MIRLPAKSWYQNNTIWQIGLAAAGGTFVDWTINYLLDISHRVVIFDYNHQVAEVPKNPCLKNNAHKHCKNHPKDIGEMLWHSKLLHDIAPNQTHSFYTYHHTQSLNDQLYLKNNFQAMAEFFSYIAPCPQIIVYDDFALADLFLVYRYLVSRLGLTNLDDVVNQDPSLAEHMKDVCLPWIKRELLAIEFHRRRQHQRVLLDQQQNLTDCLAECVLPIGISQIFTDLDKLLPLMFSRFNTLPWRRDKVTHWLEIYRQWQVSNSQIEWFQQMPNWVEDIIAEREVTLSAMDEIAQCCLEAELMRQGRSICNHGMIQLPTGPTVLRTEPLIHDLESITQLKS